MMSKALKGSLAAAAGIALGLTGAGAAFAQDEEAPAPAASGTVDSSEAGIGLNGTLDGVPESVNANLLRLSQAEDDSRLVYCIQITQPLQTQNVYEERAWEEIPVDDLPMVLGVLTTGFTGDNAAEVIEASGVSLEETEFSAEQIAYAGTQAAVWNLTDGFELNADDPTAGAEGVDEAVLAVQTHLLEDTEPVEEPDSAPYFEVDDSEAAVDGTTVGPFSVGTNIGPINFTQPEGATLVDENGEEITALEDGQQIYIEFADEVADTVTIAADKITVTTPMGRVFVPTSAPAADFVPQTDTESEDIEGQRVILAEEHTEELSGEYTFDIAFEEVEETPEAKLPVTGSSLTTVAGIGAAVLVIGVAAMVYMRRRAATAGGSWGDDEK